MAKTSQRGGANKKGSSRSTGAAKKSGAPKKQTATTAEAAPKSSGRSRGGSSYTAEDITVLEGLEAVRKR
ncbi:MAG TPA: hypothetical protein VFL56_01895, partial [Solirubrobacterales bacterium]|nr:hypothetical protein [Solirubrobacterales bacterium]